MSSISFVGSPPQGGGIRKMFAALFVGLSAGLVWAGTAIAEPIGSYRGLAYGTFANSKAGQVAVTLGRSALQPCPCTGTNGEVRSNRVHSIRTGDDGAVFSAGNTVSTGETHTSADTAKIHFVSRIEDLSMFDGMITADAVTAVAHTDVGNQNIESNSDQSSFLNLRIGDQSFARKVKVAAPSAVASR